MKKIILLVLIFVILLIGLFGVLAENNNMEDTSSIDSTKIECKNLYFYDNSVRECGYKKFCGMYMYEGLHTFEKMKECQDEIKKENEAKGGPSESHCSEISTKEVCNNYADICLWNDETNSCSINSKNPGQGKTKILPETASVRARERLGDLGFNITLKEIGNGNQTKSIYFAEAEKEGKFLGLFKVKGKVSAEIDSETGEVIKINKPWWSGLAGI